MQGLSYAQARWPSELSLPPNQERHVICYKLVAANSAAQPFILQSTTIYQDCPPVATEPKKVPPVRTPQSKPKDSPTPSAKNNEAPDPGQVEGCRQQTGPNKEVVNPTVWTPCTALDAQHPLKARELLVVGLDVRDAPDALKLLNINVTNQQGSPLNSTPVRPSVQAPANVNAAAASKQPPGVYYLTWPNQLSGDSVPTVTINAVYAPAVPGAVWQTRTFYPAGSVVISSSRNGHYYTALSGGISGDDEPIFPAYAAVTFKDNELTWADSGTSAPSGSDSKPTTWIANHSYKLGDVILDPYNGHYYTVVTAPAPVPSPTPPTPGSGPPASQPPTGLSGPPPDDPFPIAPPIDALGQKSERISDGRLLWEDAGTALPTGANKVDWKPGVRYHLNDVVLDNSNSHYYRVIAAEGASGLKPAQPNFPITPMAVVTERPSQLTVRENDLTWEDEGPFGPATPTNIEPWAPTTSYKMGATVYDPSTQRVYKVTAVATGETGKSGLRPPFFPASPGYLTLNAELAGIRWQDSGTTAPASAASAQPQDQVVSLLNFTLPQAHALYYFNLSSGLVATTVRNPSFVSNGAKTPSIHEERGNLTIDPILFLTVYFRGFDAESPYSFKRDAWPPGLILGLSLSSPGSNYYVGASFEIQRNIQLVAGVTVAKTTRLVSGIQQNPAMPVTTQKFSAGAFMGLTFNVSGFIQSLFTGGGGKGP